MMFVVIQKGVYRHGVVGVFDSFEGARTAAINAHMAERDDYHDFEIVECDLNHATSPESDRVVLKVEMNRKSKLREVTGEYAVLSPEHKEISGAKDRR